MHPSRLPCKSVSLHRDAPGHGCLSRWAAPHRWYTRTACRYRMHPSRSRCRLVSLHRDAPDRDSAREASCRWCNCTACKCRIHSSRFLCRSVSLHRDAPGHGCLSRWAAPHRWYTRTACRYRIRPNRFPCRSALAPDAAHGHDPARRSSLFWYDCCYTYRHRSSHHFRCRWLLWLQSLHKHGI